MPAWIAAITGAVAAIATSAYALIVYLDRRDRRNLEAAGDDQDRRFLERRAALREQAILRALRASTTLAGAAGTYIDAELVRLRGRGRLRPPPTDITPLNKPIEEISAALDEIRYLGPPELVEAMGSYFDRAMEVREAALAGIGDVQAGVEAAGRQMHEAKEALIEVANEGGLDIVG